MVPSVNTTVGDLNFNFNDSCNCCGWCTPKLKDNQEAFIKKDGRVTKFDPSKTDDKVEANRLTIARLESSLASLARAKSMHPDKLKARVQKETGYDINPASPQKLNIGQLRRIDTIFKRVRSEQVIPPTPVEVISRSPPIKKN